MKQKPGPKPKKRPWIFIRETSMDQTHEQVDMTSTMDRTLRHMYSHTDFIFTITGSFDRSISRSFLRKEMRKAINAWFHGDSNYFKHVKKQTSADSPADK